MNSRAAYAAVSLAIVSSLAACQPSAEPKAISYQDLQAYNAWVQSQKDKDAKAGFKAKPLSVSATGKVQAVPDVAVITARISAEHLNESRALSRVAQTVNAVQTALKDKDATAGFTAINSTVKTDQKCLNTNALAQQRHSQITSDYWFNTQLDARGDKETERREAKPRLARSTCGVSAVKVTTDMVIRVRPAEEAGAVLRALGDANVTSGQLYGYDFSDYDSLYQAAAEKAVSAARRKAEMITGTARTELGEITDFRVGSPARTGRFGLQPNIVNRHKGITSYGAPVFKTISEPVVVQEASTELVTIPATYETVTETRVVQPQYTDGMGNLVPAVTKQVTRRVVKTPASTQERMIPSVTKMETRRVLKTPASPPPPSAFTASGVQSNALQMSLLSGPQTISVTASLSYDYKTPIDGTHVPEGLN